MERFTQSYTRAVNAGTSRMDQKPHMVSNDYIRLGQAGAALPGRPPKRQSFERSPHVELAAQQSSSQDAPPPEPIVVHQQQKQKRRSNGKRSYEPRMTSKKEGHLPFQAIVWLALWNAKFPIPVGNIYDFVTTFFPACVTPGSVSWKGSVRENVSKSENSHMFEKFNRGEVTDPRSLQLKGGRRQGAFWTFKIDAKPLFDVFLETWLAKRQSLQALGMPMGATEDDWIAIVEGRMDLSSWYEVADVMDVPVQQNEQVEEQPVEKKPRQQEKRRSHHEEEEYGQMNVYGNPMAYGYQAYVYHNAVLLQQQLRYNYSLPQLPAEASRSSSPFSDSETVKVENSQPMASYSHSPDHQQYVYLSQAAVPSPSTPPSQPEENSQGLNSYEPLMNVDLPLGLQYTQQLYDTYQPREYVQIDPTTYDPDGMEKYMSAFSTFEDEFPPVNGSDVKPDL